MNGPCAEGWRLEPGRSLPISYAMNGCATTWYPDAGDDALPHQSPLSDAEVTRPVDTILVGESTWFAADLEPHYSWAACLIMFTHLKYPGPGGNANFIFFDGHARAMKWGQTLFPINQNKWVLNPDPDPNNCKINGPPGCQYTVPDPWRCTGNDRPDMLQ